MHPTSHHHETGEGTSVVFFGCFEHFWDEEDGEEGLG